MINFKIREGVIVVDYNMLMVPEFVSIIDSLGMKRGLLGLRYIYLTCDLGINNPLRHIDYSIREQEAERLVYGSRWDKRVDEYPLIERGMAAYELYGSSGEERMLYVYDKQIDDIRRKIDEMRVDGIEDGIEDKIMSGKKYNDILSGYLKNLDLLYNAKKKVRDLILSGTSGNKLRGNKKSSLIESGTLRSIGSESGL